MTRKRILGALTLLVFGVTTLQCAATPTSTIRQAAPVAHLGQIRDARPLVPMEVRSFGLNPRTGLEVLDERAEVLFDS